MTEAIAPQSGWRNLPRRHKAITALLVLVLVLAVLVFGWAAYLNHKLADIPRSTPISTARAVPPG